MKTCSCLLPRRRRRYCPSSPRLLVSDIEAALPHLASFKNLQEFRLGNTDLKNTSLGVLTPIFSATTGTLKRLQCAHRGADIYETWKAISTLADLLSNLAHVNLLGYQGECSEVQIRLSLTRNARLPSGVSTSTNFRSSTASLIPSHSPSPVAPTFKSLISTRFVNEYCRSVSHLPLIAV